MRVARPVGLLSPVTVALVVAVSVVRAPAFSFPDDALSDLGVTPGVAPLFNGGLVVAGLLGLVYAVSRLRDFEGPRRLAAVALVGAAVALSLVGAFPLGTPIHVPAATTVLLLAPIAILLDGIGALRASERTFGLVSITLVVLYVVSWALFYLGVRLGSGLAIPETIGAALLGLWVILSVVWSPPEALGHPEGP